MKKNLFFILSIISSQTLFGQNITTLAPDYDAALGYHDFYGTENNNYGNATQNSAYCKPGASGGLNMNRAMIHFDLSSFSNPNDILEAKLNLYAFGPISGVFLGHTGANNALLSRVSAPWLENTITWSSAPSINATNQIMLPQSTSYTQDYLNIDVTQLIKDMISYGNYGFNLKLVNESPTNALLFCSSNHSDISKHPVLQISYTGLNVESYDNDFIQIFPNPTSDFINFKLKNSIIDDNFTLEIIDILGNVVRTVDVLNQSKVDISDLELGTYFARITSNENIYTTKFQKK